MEENVPPGSICCFCRTTYDDEALYGKIYKIEEITTHYFCLLLSSKVQQKGSDEEGILGFLPMDIRNEIRRGKNVTCTYCGKRGATISCHYSKCKIHFHLPCGRTRDTFHQFFGEFKSFCCRHRKTQKIMQSVLRAMSGKQSICSICLESVPATPSPSTLWAPCCSKDAWFHRLCIQRLALSAGYFFKCPLCNNTAQFVESMRSCGIWIPEQDASWERDPERYEGLLQRHNSCDAKSCRCRQGRTFHLENTKWEIKLCADCGSQGMHVHCGNLRVTQDWVCSVCSNVIAPKGDLQETGKISRTRDALMARNRLRRNLPIRNSHQRLTRQHQTPEEEEEEEDEREDEAIRNKEGKRRKSEDATPRMDKVDSSAPQKGASAHPIPDITAHVRDTRHRNQPPTPANENSDVEIIEDSDDDIQHGRAKKNEPLACNCKWSNQINCSQIHSDGSNIFCCCYDGCQQYLHIGKPCSPPIKNSENLISRFLSTLTSLPGPPLVKGEPLCQLWVIHYQVGHSQKRSVNGSTSRGLNRDLVPVEDEKQIPTSAPKSPNKSLSAPPAPKVKAECSRETYCLRRSHSCQLLHEVSPTSPVSRYHLRSSSSSGQQFVHGIKTSRNQGTPNNNTSVTSPSSPSKGRSALTSQRYPRYRAKSVPRSFEYCEKTSRPDTESPEMLSQCESTTNRKVTQNCSASQDMPAIPSKRTYKRRSSTPCGRKLRMRTVSVTKSCCSEETAPRHTNQTRKYSQSKRKRSISNEYGDCDNKSCANTTIIGNGLQLARLPSFQPIVLLKRTICSSEHRLSVEQITGRKERRSRKDQFVHNQFKISHIHKLQRRTSFSSDSTSQQNITSSKMKQGRKSNSQAVKSMRHSPVRTRSSSRSKRNLEELIPYPWPSQNYCKRKTGPSTGMIMKAHENLFQVATNEVLLDGKKSSAPSVISSSDETDDEVLIENDHINQMPLLIATISEYGRFANKDIGSLLPKNGSLATQQSASSNGNFNGESISSSEESSSSPTSLQPSATSTRNCSSSPVPSSPSPTDLTLPSVLSPLASVVVPSESTNPFACISQHSSSLPLVTSPLDSLESCSTPSTSTVLSPPANNAVMPFESVSVNPVSPVLDVPLRRSQRSPRNSVLLNYPHCPKRTSTDTSSPITIRGSSPPPIFPNRSGGLTKMQCRIKAQTLTARKFLPKLKTATHQHAMVRHLQGFRGK